MKKLQSLKISQLVQEDILNVDELAKVKAGTGDDIMLLDGCYTGICSIQINPEYCKGGAVCTKGIAG